MMCAATWSTCSSASPAPSSAVVLGTAGRVENAQVAVYLAYAAAAGSTLIDREVYLPKAWTDDPARCAAAGVPEQVRFATKITLGRRMLARAQEASRHSGADSNRQSQPSSGVNGCTHR
jgi:hypothetical protein